MTYIHIEPKAFKEVSVFKWVHILRRFSSQAPRVRSDSAGIKLGSREKIKRHLSEQESLPLALFQRCHDNSGPWDFKESSSM